MSRSNISKQLKLKENEQEPNQNSQGESSDMISKVEVKSECPVCLQTCVHPVRLPCSHVFCYLCVKGVANRSKRCAMCRQEIPAGFLTNPELLCQQDVQKEADMSDGHRWYYEGWNGWWQYDARASCELEEKFELNHLQPFEILIAGFLYVIDFENMIQYRRNDPTRRRRIKRDLSTIVKKGVAGLKVPKSQNISDNNTEEDMTTHERIQADGVEDEEEDMSLQSRSNVQPEGEVNSEDRPLTVRHIPNVISPPINRTVSSRSNARIEHDDDILTESMAVLSLRSNPHCPVGSDTGSLVDTGPDGTDSVDAAIRRQLHTTSRHESSTGASQTSLICGQPFEARSGLTNVYTRSRFRHSSSSSEGSNSPSTRSRSQSNHNRNYENGNRNDGQ